MNVFVFGRVEVRLSDDEAKIIANVERSRHAVHHSAMKKYRLLMSDIAKVANWKEKRMGQ